MELLFGDVEPEPGWGAGGRAEIWQMWRLLIVDLIVRSQSNCRQYTSAIASLFKLCDGDVLELVGEHFGGRAEMGGGRVK